MPRLLSHLLALALLLGALTHTRRAEAQPIFLGSGEGALVLMGVIVAVGGVVASVGTQVTMFEGNPSPGWGRASIALGAINTAVGGGFLIASGVETDGRFTSDYGIGITDVSIGANGLLWGLVNEGLLPEQDPGIFGQPRPRDTALSSPATITIRGTF